MTLYVYVCLCVFRLKVRAYLLRTSDHHIHGRADDTGDRAAHELLHETMVVEATALQFQYRTGA